MSLYTCIFICKKIYFVVNGQILVPIIWLVLKSFSFHGFNNAKASFLIHISQTNSPLHIWCECHVYSLVKHNHYVGIIENFFQAPSAALQH